MSYMPYITQRVIISFTIPENNCAKIHFSGGTMFHGITMRSVKNEIYSVSQKTMHLTFDHNFVKCYVSSKTD